MKKTAVGLFAIAMVAGNARAQSVAQTLATLNSKVASLEARPSGGETGSPFLQSASDADGGAFRVLNVQKKIGAVLQNNKFGGEVDINGLAGSIAASLFANSGGGHLWFYNTAHKRTVEVGIGGGGSTGGIWVYDTTGEKVLAAFGTSADDAAGRVEVNGVKVHDYAEVFDIADCRNLSPGAVVAASPDGKGIQLSARAYDPAAVGVLSGAGSFQPGMRIGSREDGTSDLPVAVSGQVYVRISSEGGPIKVGDLLVSSSIPGVAMRGADPARLTGTVIGKALQPYAGELGESKKPSLIRMLVLNR